MVPSTLNWTVPVGVPVPVAGRTVAVRVTFCPKLEGAGLLVTTVVDGRAMVIRFEVESPAALYAVTRYWYPAAGSAVASV